MTARLASSFCFLAVLVGTTGCGTKTNPNAPANFSGKVTYKKEAVSAGTVWIHPSEGGAYQIEISSDGSFNGTELPAGEVTVTIETESANKKKVEYAKGPDKGKMYSPVPEGSTSVAAGAYVKIPAKYADKTKSGLTMKLERGPNKKDFDLVD